MSKLLSPSESSLGVHYRDIETPRLLRDPSTLGYLFGGYLLNKTDIGILRLVRHGDADSVDTACVSVCDLNRGGRQTVVTALFDRTIGIETGSPVELVELNQGSAGSPGPDSYRVHVVNHDTTFSSLVGWHHHLVREQGVALPIPSLQNLMVPYRELGRLAALWPDEA